MTRPPAGPAPEHNPGLDVVRSTAILLVMFAHASDWVLTDSMAVVRATSLGSMGVELFFGLSGFLIGGILLRLCEAELTWRGLVRFWLRRWARTLPAYYVVVAAMCWWFDAWRWPMFLFAQNFMPADRWTPLLPHTWSLVLEEWFYLLFPLLLLPLARVRHAVPLVCAVLIAACTTAQGLAMHGMVRLGEGEYYINPLLRLDAPAWGVLAAWWLRRRSLGAWACAACLAAGVAATAWQVWAFTLAFRPADLAGLHYAAWGPAYEVLHTTSTSLGLVLVVVGTRGLLSRPVPAVSAVAGPLAALSYALYLAHVPVMYLCYSYLTVVPEGLARKSAIIVLIVAASLLLRHGVERPVLRLRDRFVPERRTARTRSDDVGHHADRPDPAVPQDRHRDRFAEAAPGQGHL